MLDLTCVGKRLRKIRKQKHLIQPELAELTGFSVRSLQAWEKGSALPSAYGLAALAIALDVSADYLLGLTDDLR